MELLTLSPLSPSPVDWIALEKLEAGDLSSILPLAMEFVEPWDSLGGFLHHGFCNHKLLREL